MEPQTQPKMYGPIQSVLLTVFIFIASQIAAAVLVGLIPLFLGWDSARAANWVQDNVWGTFAFVALLEAVNLGLVYALLKNKQLNIRSLGVGTFKINHIGLAVAGFVVYFLVYIVGIVVIKSLVPSLDLEQKQEIGFETTTAGISLLPVFISLVILPPVAEEIVARGFLFGGLRTKLPFLSAAVITSAMFAAAHITGAKEGLLWVATIDTFILSLVLCYLREKTGSLWPPIAVHMIKNGLAFVLLFNIAQYI